MNTELRNDLLKCETDVDGALRRFSNNEELYVKCLSLFLADQTMAELQTALDTQSWDDVFTAAHALKGLAGNMGFIPLFHASAKMVIEIRAGKTEEAVSTYAEVNQCYKEIHTVLIRHCGV